MNKEKFSEAIINKLIPISFIYKDKNEYSLQCYTPELRTNNNMFPIWKEFNYNILCELSYFNDINTVFMSNRLSFDRCYVEFLTWFEKNKELCITLTYYS